MDADQNGGARPVRASHPGVQSSSNNRRRLVPGSSENNEDHISQQRINSTSSNIHLKYGAQSVIDLFIPVSLCMAIVVATMKATNTYQYSSENIIWYASVMFTDQTVDTKTRILQSFANAFILLIFIIIMTTVLILLYKFKFYKVIHGWLILSSLMLLFIFTLMYLAELFKAFNVSMDNITMSIFIWNFGVVGMICIHWKGPLLLQQAYLISISALMALVFIRSLPDWTTWTVLGIVSIWDLVAVLCPRGPLRILVETAQERDEPIFPALIYSSAMMFEVGVSMADTNQRSNAVQNKTRHEKRNQHRSKNRRASAKLQETIHSTSEPRDLLPIEIVYDDDAARPPEVSIIQPNLSNLDETPETSIPENTQNNRRTQPNPNIQSRDHSNSDEERGVKLGLGDFIFFSLLVGKASSFNDWTVTIACYVTILVGLSLTLTLLAVFKKALPALPISIALGLCSFFLTLFLAVPLADELSTNQVFV